MSKDVPQVYSVSELTRLVKNVVEKSFGPLTVRGEISNYVLHSSGHRYFSLKDESSLLRCVMFRSAGAKLRFEPENGLLVEARGSLTVYEKGGQYQLLLDSMAPAGLGSLQQALEILKKRLAKEGLFDEKNKKPLPRYPGTVGVVTSPTGAAIRDILRVLKRRCPSAQVIVCPVRVQGEGAADEIAEGIEMMNRLGGVDVLIEGRGGGSLEDLWAFNEERVARAAFASEVPIVSAVGHEIDFTIIDFVADRRAPTPSAAAEIVVRDSAEVLAYLSRERSRLETAVRKTVGDRRRDVERLVSSYGFRKPIDVLRQGSQRLDELQHAVVVQWWNWITRKRETTNHCHSRLRALDPHGILKRGYCICSTEPAGETVTRASQVAGGDSVGLRFWEGKAVASIVRTSDEEEGAGQGRG